MPKIRLQFKTPPLIVLSHPKRTIKKSHTELHYYITMPSETLLRDTSAIFIAAYFFHSLSRRVSVIVAEKMREFQNNPTPWIYGFLSFFLIFCISKKSIRSTIYLCCRSFLMTVGCFCSGVLSAFRKLCTWFATFITWLCTWLFWGVKQYLFWCTGFFVYYYIYQDVCKNCELPLLCSLVFL